VREIEYQGVKTLDFVTTSTFVVRIDIRSPYRRTSGHAHVMTVMAITTIKSQGGARFLLEDTHNNPGI
jgi:hypothetical protein